MFTNKKISEALPCVGAIAPISQGVGTVVSGWIDVKNLHAVQAAILTGILGASATIDAKFQQATVIAGSDAKDVTGKAITQIVKATGDGKVVKLNLRPQDLDTNGGFHFIQLSITVGTAASLVGAYIEGAGRYEPASGFDNAIVVQTV